MPASRAVPGIGPSLQKPFQEYLEAQRQKLHHRSEAGTAQVRIHPSGGSPAAGSRRLKLDLEFSRFLDGAAEVVYQSVCLSVCLVEFQEQGWGNGRQDSVMCSVVLISDELYIQFQTGLKS